MDVAMRLYLKVLALTRLLAILNAAGSLFFTRSLTHLTNYSNLFLERVDEMREIAQ